MSKGGLRHNIHSSGANRVPACQWNFDRTRCFRYVGGDSAGLFHRSPGELLRRPVTIIDDPQRTWAARLERMFSGKVPFEQWTASISGVEHTLIQIALPAKDGTVMYTAGFDYPAGRALPAVAELELAARAVLQALETERTRTTRFLHDVVAQCLSGTGLQLELLQLELPARQMVLRHSVAEIQRALEDALQQVREFSGKGYSSAAH
jgi:signal transduction histidine kinase